jgi:hypothetical protein
LVVSSTMPPKSVGEAFFVSQTAQKTKDHVLLLIRVAETQLDDLFAPELVEQARTLTER